MKQEKVISATPQQGRAMVVKKPTEAIVMIPTLGKLTAAGRKIFNVILHATQDQAREIESSGAEVSATHFFKARLIDIAGAAAPSGSDLRTVGKRYLQEMASVRVDWESPDQSSGVVWRSMGLLSEVEISVDSMEGGFVYVRWALPPSLLAAVLDPKRFTLLDIEEISKLKSYQAVALYEICARYKNNPSGLTSRNEPLWWADALTGSPRIDKKTGARQIRDWRKIKSESVLKAIAEINENTDIEIDLVETKTGKAVTGVQFSVKRKSRPTESETAKAKITLATVQIAAGLDISLSQVASLISNGHEPAVVEAALKKVRARSAREDLEKIESPSGYLAAVTKELSSHIKESALAVATQEQEPSAPSAPVLSFRERRIVEIKKELLSKPLDLQQELADVALEQLKGARQVTPAVAKNYESRFWSGILLSRMLQIYIKQSYSEDWDIDPTRFTNANAQAQGE